MGLIVEIAILIYWLFIYRANYLSCKVRCADVLTRLQKIVKYVLDKSIKFTDYKYRI
jgi:hypothetical protein